MSLSAKALHLAFQDGLFDQTVAVLYTDIAPGNPGQIYTGISPPYLPRQVGIAAAEGRKIIFLRAFCSKRVGIWVGPGAGSGVKSFNSVDANWAAQHVCRQTKP